MFKPATRQQARLRLGLVGPAGSGKTYTALRVAHGLGERIALIDTEHGSASKYAGEVEDGHPFRFDAIDLSTMRGGFSPDNYIAAIEAAGRAGYDVCVIDSLSHAWSGPGGVLDIVDKAASRSNNNTYAGWRTGTPAHNRLIDAILASPCHVVATMRSKAEYVIEKDERTGKNAPRKIGTQPIQREGMDFEFDVVGDLDQDHKLVITKTRCSALDGAVITKPGADLARALRDWLGQGEAPETPAQDPGATADGAHHESFRADQRRFFAELKRLEVEYAPLTEYLAAKRKPRPSAMTQEERDILMTWLEAPKNRAAVMGGGAK
jgi:hypothetical protein